jgi:hypothetical protein
MSKIRYILITGVLMVLLGTAVIKLNAESIRVGDYTGNVGDVISVNVAVNGTDISGISFDLIFDNITLYALNVSEGDFMKNACNTTFNTILPEINNTAGIITFYNFCWGEMVNGSGVIATITFNLTKSGGSDLLLQNLTVFGEGEGGNPTNKSFMGNNGTVNVHECDLNHDGIYVKDWSNLMSAYKCFLGVEINCNSINVQEWNLMKREYECFLGNFN